MSDIRFLTPLQAREMLGLGRATIYRALKSGEIPSVRIGRLIRIPKRALEAMSQGEKRAVGSP